MIVTIDDYQVDILLFSVAVGINTTNSFFKKCVNLSGDFLDFFAKVISETNFRGLEIRWQ